MSDLPTREPDLVVTEQQAIDEGEIVPMDCWGIATFRGEPITTVSRTLSTALANAFSLAATAGISLTETDWNETIAEMGDTDYTRWVRQQDSFDGIVKLVPPWAVLGELLQVLIADAEDTSGPNELLDYLYATPPIKALQGRPIWLQRPAAGRWTAFLPEDY